VRAWNFFNDFVSEMEAKNGVGSRVKPTPTAAKSSLSVLLVAVSAYLGHRDSDAS